MSIAMSTSPTETSGQAAQKLLASLSSLTYQQKQLVRDGEYSAVLHHILGKRRATNIVVAAIAFLIAYFAIDSIISGGLPWLRGSFCVCLFWWLYTRLAAERAAVRSMPKDADLSGTKGLFNDLASELRLKHSLSYDHLQLLKQGRVNEAATAVAAVRRENGLKLLFWILPLGGTLIFAAIWRYLESYSTPLLLLMHLLMIAIICLMMVMGAIRELRIASELTEKINATAPRFE